MPVACRSFPAPPWFHTETVVRAGPPRGGPGGRRAVRPEQQVAAPREHIERGADGTGRRPVVDDLDLGPAVQIAPRLDAGGGLHAEAGEAAGQGQGRTEADHAPTNRVPQTIGVRFGSVITCATLSHGSRRTKFRSPHRNVWPVISSRTSTTSDYRSPSAGMSSVIVPWFAS